MSEREDAYKAAVTAAYDAYRKALKAAKHDRWWRYGTRRRLAGYARDAAIVAAWDAYRKAR